MHAPSPQPLNPLVTAPILPTLVGLAWPNMVAMVATALVAIAETAYVGLLGTAPLAGATLFSRDPGVLASARSYLTLSGPGFAFLGLGVCLYFASRGAGQVLGPVLAGTIRLVVVALGGWWLVAAAAPQWTMFALVAIAMAAYGIATAAAVYGVSWEQSKAAPLSPAGEIAACAGR